MTLQARLALAVAATLLVLIGAIAAAIMLLCQGHLIYSLDDPYISLALSDQIAHGHYGINATEASSPSSSVLYPFLLAAFAWTRWQEWMPAIVNATAACTAGAVIAQEFCRLGIVSSRDQISHAATLIVVLCLAINVLGLVFVGLEHSLHLLTSLLVVFGLARVFENDRLPRGLVPAIALLPLWRFEGLALAGLAIAALGLAGQRRSALTAALAIAGMLGLYMAAMAKLGLPLLPSSVLIKSDLARHAAQGSGLAVLWQGVSNNLFNSLHNTEAYPVFLLLALMIVHPLWRRLGRAGPARLSLVREYLFVGVVAGALAAQMLFGAWGWFARYEAYAVAIGVAGVIVVWRDAIAALFTRGSAVGITAAAVMLLVTGRAYVFAEVVTPIASLGIYEQEYQMHRFAAEFYQQPVGVNDLGWVSYRNPNYVLDLWGLGSEAARTARAQADSDPSWLARLVTARHVGLVMIYDQWFAGQIPADWHRVAMLQAAHCVTSPFDTVSFYATSDDAEKAAHSALQDFGRNIGPGTRLTLFDTPPTNALASPRTEISPTASP